MPYILYLYTFRRFKISTDGRRLQITQAQVRDTAKYTCIASNDAGTADRDFDLSVLDPPFIEGGGEENLKVVRGRHIVLNCQTSGIPFPNITWLKEDKPIFLGDRLRLLANGRQLEIQNAQEVDTSSYICRASSIAGQAQKLFNLLVLGL